MGSNNVKLGPVTLSNKWTRDHVTGGPTLDTLVTTLWSSSEVSWYPS